jgi:hypothetical protein
VARQARAHVPLARLGSPAWHPCRAGACGAAKATCRARPAKGVTQWKKYFPEVNFKNNFKNVEIKKILRARSVFGVHDATSQCKLPAVSCPRCSEDLLWLSCYSLLILLFFLWAETRKSIRLNFAVCMLARAVSVKDGGLDGFHGTPPHLPWPVVHAAHLAQARRSHLLIRIRRDNKWPPN